MFPQVQKSLCGRLIDLEKRVLDHSTDIEHWFRSQWRSHSPPFYGSVDLRNACFKLAPVDTNLFPGGFNNLSESALPVAVQALMVSVETHCPYIARVLLIPENHTRNNFYLANIARLRDLLQQAGLEVRIGSLNPEITEPTELNGQTSLGDSFNLLIEPLVRQANQLGLKNFEPCLVLLNNDLSAGVPPVLRGLVGQKVFPPLHGGWASRRKTEHFSAYNSVAEEFAQRLQIDPWLINPLFSQCRGLDFQARLGEETLADAVSDVLAKTQMKYKEHGIRQQPFVIVKADAGTYGMGIMTVKDPADVLRLNRKQRNKMTVGKEGLVFSDVIVQEGVHSFETVEQPEGAAVAEPVVYMIDRFVVGGFYRVHVERGPDENLNAPGARFVPLPFEEGCQQPVLGAEPDATPNRLYLYGVISRLALLAASRELKATHPASQSLTPSLSALTP